MSSATDFLMYVNSHSDKGLRPFLDKVGEETRFNSEPQPVDTGSFNGPNVFMGEVYAFGADYFDSDVQELLDSVQWSQPQAVVVLTRHEGQGGYVADPDTRVFRPRFVEHKQGWSMWVSQPQFDSKECTCETCAPK